MRNDSFLNSAQVYSFILIVLSLFVCSDSLQADDSLSYGPYLNDESPEIVETVEKHVKDGVSIHKFKFLSRVKDGEKVIIFGILAKPVSGHSSGNHSDKNGKYPGVLVVHGGGGSADLLYRQVFSWAKKGYISFCQDQPGICNPKHRSTGPKSSFVRCANSASTLKTFSPYDGVVAALNGLRIIRSQPDVDTNRIGVTGGSWGGYMTTMVSGIAGDRIKASFSHYGCGFYDAGSHWTAGLENLNKEDRKRWLENLDAGRWAHNIKSHFMLTSPTNDWYFWPGAMMKTYNAIKSDKNFCIAVNVDHQLRFPGGTISKYKGHHRSYMEVQWMNYYLKGIGDPFGKCIADKKVTRQGNDIKVGFSYEGVNSNEGVDIWYTYGETPSRSSYWKRVSVIEDGEGHYSGLIPVYETGLPISWFGIIYDRYDKDGREYSTSTTYQMTDPLSVGFKSEDRRTEPFHEGFENLVTRWKIPSEETMKGKGRYEISSVAAHNGSKGLHLIGQQTVSCYGLRGEAFKHSSDGIYLWVKNTGGKEFDVQLRGQEPNNKRHYWISRQKNTGVKWVRLFIPWSSFVYQKKGHKPVEMLSFRLEQLRFITQEKSDIYIDDVTISKK